MSAPESGNGAIEIGNHYGNHYKAIAIGNGAIAAARPRSSTQLQPYTQNFRSGTEVPFFGSRMWALLKKQMGTKTLHFGCPNENSETTFRRPTSPKNSYFLGHPTAFCILYNALADIIFARLQIVLVQTKVRQKLNA